MESLQSVLSCEEILDLQQQAQNILIHEEVENYLLDIVKATREHNLRKLVLVHEVL